MQKLRKVWLGLAVLMLVSICAIGVRGEEIKGTGESKKISMISENFEDETIAVDRFNLNRSDWEVSDGVLKTKNSVSRMVTFTIGAENRCDYETEFKVKRLELNPKDQHFGINLEGEEYVLQIYCRGEQIGFREKVGDKFTRHTEIFGKLPEPMGVGEKAKWSHFKIIFKGNEVKVYVDNVLVSTIEAVLPQKKRVTFYAYNLNLLLDDLMVIPSELQGREEKKETGNTRNIVSNSSFEYCTEPGLADYWGCPHWGLVDPYWVVNFEEWRKNFRVDESTAFEGKRSMRINNPFDKPSESGLWLRSTLLYSTSNKEYTLSAYMKGKPSGMKISFAGNEISLTEEWKRYSTIFVNKGNKGYYGDMFDIYPVTRGTFWVDAVQMEAGKELSSYGHSVGDSISESHIKNVSEDATEVPKLKPEKIEDNITLDGELNESCWQKLKKLDFLLINGDVPAEKTIAYLCYNGKGIYIGIKCYDELSEKNECKLTEKYGQVMDQFVWNDPSVEIFIDPKLSRTYYYHLAFNQKGTQYDASNADAVWNSQWEVATKTHKDFWSAEVFLPFGSFGIDRLTSDWWGININRENHNKKEYSCWSPTYGGFHSPERFGQVYFDKKTMANYYLRCEDIKFQLLSPKEASLFFKIINDTDKEVNFLLEVSLKNSKKETVNKYNQSINLPVGAEKEISFGKVKIANQGEKYSLDISLLSPDKSSIYYYATKYLVLPAFFEIKPQYSLYTKEKEMLLKAKFNLNQEKLKECKLGIEIKGVEGGSVLEEKFTNLFPEMDVSMKIEKLPYGDYNLTAVLSDKKNKIIASSIEKFKKLPPKPNEVKIDKISRIITVDGTPFIPFGFHLEGNPTPEVLNYYAENGFNITVIQLRNSNLPWVEYLGPVLDNASKAGIKVVVMGSAGQSEKEKARVREMIGKFNQHPAVIGWCIFDEIFTLEWGKENYKSIAETLEYMKDISPYQLVFIVENRYGLTYLKSKNLDFPGDIAEVDYYAMPPSGSVPMTTEYVKMAEEMSRKDGKPVWVYLFGGGYAFWASREHTSSEKEFTVYTSIINGASGIFYLADHPRSKSQWEKIKEMAREIKELTPIIASPAKVPAIKCVNTDIQILVKKFKGHFYLITVNGSKKSVNAKFDLSDFTLAKNSLKVLFENRELSIKDNIFEDTFEGYQRHVYEIEYSFAK